MEAYERRTPPWKEPHYSIWQANMMWGCDWMRLKINYIRWYLLVLIDFFSRYLISYGIFPSINSTHIRYIHQKGLKEQRISSKSNNLPELRVDRGSPNTSYLTKDFFDILGVELSFARVRWPTNNAITERLFGTIKQEEVYLVGNYPDERSGDI